MVLLLVILSIFSQVIFAVLGYDKIISDVPDNATNVIFFLFVKGPTIRDYIVIPYEDALSIPEQENFNAHKVTVFYLPGWGEKPQDSIDSVNTIAQAYMDTSQMQNLVILDYSQLVKSDEQLDEYISAVKNTTIIGAALGHFFKHYIPTVQPNEKVHLVSHSLGCQIMSKTAKAYGQGQLYWLTALDAAGPLFGDSKGDHLVKEDGQFVDTIHTDGYFYGDARAYGHADFFPNLGTRVQPACQRNISQDFCSHAISWRYYAESIRNPTAFPAKRCSVNLFCSLFGLSYCCLTNSQIAYMGAGANRLASGTYYLKTGDKSPYGLGEKGLYV